MFCCSSSKPHPPVKSLCHIYLWKTSHLTSRVSVTAPTRKRSRVNISIWIINCSVSTIFLVKLVYRGTLATPETQSTWVWKTPGPNINDYLCLSLSLKQVRWWLTVSVCSSSPGTPGWWRSWWTPGSGWWRVYERCHTRPRSRCTLRSCAPDP